MGEYTIATVGVADETSDYVAHAATEVDAQREELNWLLTSGVLGRSGNLTRALRYVCEERFQGRSDQIKEYTIATEALGRRPNFDPQTDAIVRVTFHSLRRRLLEVYQAEGMDRPMRLVIPPGSYAPSFVHHRPLGRLHTAVEQEAPYAGAGGDASISDPADDVATPQLSTQPSVWRLPSRFIITTTLSLMIAGAVMWVVRHQQAKRTHPAEPTSSSAAMPLPPPQDTIRTLMGSGRKPYVDHSGNTWAAGNYCQGGTNVAVPSQKIEGTEDTPLYLGGVRGIAHCVFPVTHGRYELHFHFAETSDLPPATLLATLSINAGPAIGVDVVDNAGGHGIATSTVVTGVVPENDGTIHLDFTSEISLLNAVEILPAPSAKLLPVRIVASSKPFVDSVKQVWTSDRYFSGGRRGQSSGSAKRANLGIYESDRIGRFQYNIPAVPLARYRVKLYFRDPWFGKENGGPGSRVFDVACNGVLLMKNFDILAEGGSEPVVKTFENVQASADGRIELYFMPVVNYPVINAIEVLPEDQAVSIYR